MKSNSDSILKEYPLISIITTTFNRAELLPQAINSVKQQTYEQWELLIIDDGSTDDTREVVDKFRQEDNRIRYFYQENKGVGSAKNYGIDVANGDYIVFLDSDDELVNHALKTAVHTFQELYPSYGQVNIAFSCQTPEKETIGESPPAPTPITLKEVLNKEKISGEKFGIVDARIFANPSYRLPYKRGGFESMLWNRILKDGYTVLVSPTPLRIYHTDYGDRIKSSQHFLNRTAILPSLYEDYLNIFEEDYQKYAPQQLSKMYFEKAISELMWNKTQEGKYSFKKAIQTTPSKITYFCLTGPYPFTSLPSSFLRYLTLRLHKIKNKSK